MCSVLAAVKLKTGGRLFVQVFTGGLLSEHSFGVLESRIEVRRCTSPACCRVAGGEKPVQVALQRCWKLQEQTCVSCCAQGSVLCKDYADNIRRAAGAVGHEASNCGTISGHLATRTVAIVELRRMLHCTSPHTRQPAYRIAEHLLRAHCLPRCTVDCVTCRHLSHLQRCAACRSVYTQLGRRVRLCPMHLITMETQQG
jgi:hypothetical protein